MDWGIPTLLEAPGPEASAALCRELGFDFVELNMNLPEYQQWDIQRLMKAAERYEVYFTIHLDERLDLCDFNPRIAEAYLQTLVEAIEAAKHLGIPILNMHLLEGVYFTLPDKKHYLYDDGELPLRSLLTPGNGLDKPSEKEVPVTVVENTGRFSVPFLREALGRLLDSPLFGLTYDIGHDFSAGEADKPFILEHQGRLQHLHIHDALGRRNHLPLGAGEMDIRWYIELGERHRCRAVLE
ncbi:MAG: sugar phosphate isomerase/epimerase, partial [Acutalibacter sp.]|nr:sugar phosphate isomerase/epimerase [Acutalibacter sp.]